MLTESDAEKAVSWLRDNAQTIGEARAARLYMEQWIRTVRAKCMSKRAGESVAAQERDALQDQEYLDALEAYKAAVMDDERLRFLATAAEAKIECWRSQESTRRAENKAY